MATVRLPEYDQVENRSKEIKEAIGNIKVDVGPVEGKVDDLADKIAALSVAYVGTGVSGVCIVDVELNCESGYDLPSDSEKTIELLNGANVALSVDGILNPIKSSVTSLTNFRKRFVIPASDGVTVQGYVWLNLGRSESCHFGAAKVPVSITGSEIRRVKVLTSNLDGEIVEVCRIQPWDSTASGAGPSWIGTRITNANGTKFHYGCYAADGAWVDQSMTRVDVFNCPKDDAGNPLDPVRVSIATGGSSNAVPIEQRLAALRNMKEVSVDFSGSSTPNTGNKFMRYDPCFFKTEMLELPVQRLAADGSVASVQNVLCCVKWFCDVQADADYHRAPLFTRYELQEDGSYTETPLRYGYIARHALNNATLQINGVNATIATSKPDASNEVGNTRDGFLGRCRVNNGATVTIHAEGEEDQVFAPNSDPRLCSMVSLSEITFLQWMSYLYFGNNVQASMRGISVDTTMAKAQQANGTADYMFNQGVMCGSEDITSAQKQIIFLGIEGGLWSAPGWMHPDWTAVWKRTSTTDETGAIVKEETDHFYLFCQDRLKFAPLSNDESALLGNGYRRVSFQPTTAGSGYRYRMGMDDSAIMRDAYLPAASAAQKNISIGGADYQYQGSFPAVVAAYSATTKYALNAYVQYGGKLYKCIEAQAAAEPFDEAKWELQANAAIVRSNWYMVALGTYRPGGLNLGSFYVSANNALSYSGGTYWRSRLSLQPLVRDER